MILVGAFMLAMSAGMIGIWTRDIVSAGRIDRSRGRLRAREPGSGSFLLPHWLAEYATAAGLVLGGTGLLRDRAWATEVSLLALGALVYTSVNSLGWALGAADRRPYAIPIGVGAVGGVAAAAVLLGS